jgi:two-component system sensor histidine kinase MprB
VSLRRRIAVTAAAAVAVAVLLGSLVAYFVVRDTLRGQIDASLRGPAVQMSSTFSVGVPPGATPETQPLQGPAVFIQRVGERGNQVYGAVGSETARLGNRKEVQEVADGTRSPFFGDTEVDGVHVRYFTQRAPNGTAIQVARSMTEVDSALAKLRLGLGLVAIAGIALAAFLGRLATRHAVRPVTHLTETAEHVARTRDLSRRIEAAGGDELASPMRRTSCARR